MLLEGGVSLQVSLDLLRLQYRSGAWPALIRYARAALNEGRPLSAALPAHSRIFPRHYIETLKWAEGTGSVDNLALALRLLAGDATPRPLAERPIPLDSGTTYTRPPEPFDPGASTHVSIA